MNKDVYKPGSCGQVITYMICKVRNPETGQSLPPYKVGELCFKGPTVMLGYYKNEKATQESFTSDGWLRTGDLGYYDENEYFYIVDRLKEVIKYKGYQVIIKSVFGIIDFCTYFGIFIQNYHTINMLCFFGHCPTFQVFLFV